MKYRLLMACLVVATGFAVQAESWRTYQGDRFGVRLNYPSSFHVVGQSDNGDGVTLESPDGRSRLLIWGAHNMQGERPYASLCVDGCKDETYKLDTKTTGVSSGISNGMISYAKCLAAAEEFHCFRLTYPETEKHSFDPIVAHIARYLR